MKSSDKPLRLSDFDLIYGIGNVGREDDGLGWAFVDAIESMKEINAKLVRHYQLFFEDVDLLRRHQRVLFVDATKEVTTSRYAIESVMPKLDDSFTSHAISVQSIVAMCHQCYQSFPDVWLLTIKGTSWELSLGLTKEADANLKLALEGLLSEGISERKDDVERDKNT
ncbi:hydrogenase maturation protease [Enterovibrio coralii]|uniref:Ni/Fe hydrogenase n=1 Tax=Enterovibrio coralii TaxID=294935 RepID=A0A135I5B9_9GAMM|nr:hydrogenase maturation protease [Enterovibrio coralii]KXF80597.1 Ni/Fe hydrogenase [Enterovibrio coralii]